MLAIAFILVASTITGCSHMPTGIATSSALIEPGEVTILGHAKGSSGYFSLFGAFPFGTPDYEASIRDAISKVPGGTKLINIRSYSTRSYAIIGFKNTLHVEGDVVK